MPEPNKPSRQTLDNISARVISFLFATARFPLIATLLAERGYSAEAHDYAWSRLARLGELPKAEMPGADKVVRAALAELDDWDERNFELIRVTLSFGHPTVVEALFRDLEPQQGPQAAHGVGVLLDRLARMETSEDPEEVAAVALLGKHGYSQKERARLGALVQLTKGFSVPPVVDDAERETILLELYRWHTMWSAYARNTITRRDHLIALGLASRRKNVAQEGEESSPPEEGAPKDAKAEPKDAKAEPNAKPSLPDGKATQPDGAAPSPDPR